MLDEVETTRLADGLSSLTRAFFESLLYVIVGFTVNFLKILVNYIHVVYAQTVHLYQQKKLIHRDLIHFQ